MTIQHDREIVSLSSLKPAEYNPRQIDDKSMAGLKASLEKFGVVQEVVANKRTRTIVGGHQRVRALQESGVTEVPVVWVDLDEDDERALNIALNSRHISGTWTPDVRDLIAELQISTPDLVAELRLDRLLDDVKALHQPDEPEDGGGDTGGGDPPEEPDSEPGRIYRLGPHRVICGDSEDPETALELMAGEKADLLVTDPPYNVAGEGENTAAKIRPDSYGELENESWDYSFDVKNISQTLANCMANDCSAYVFTSHFLFGDVVSILDEQIGQTNYCVWAKPNPMPSLHKRHWTWSTELVAYATRGKHVFNFPPTGHALNTWDFPLQTHDRAHPTQKPLDVMKHPIIHSSKRGSKVLDLFLGSGTTLIACAELGRVCYGVELQPKFVDVIRKRWGDWARSAGRDPGSDAL